MSMLTEKRQEIATKLEKLEKTRFETIQMKLNAYRTQLEAEPESEEIKLTRKVLEAIDAVILYDIENTPAKSAPVEEVKAEEIAKDIPEAKAEEAVNIVTEMPAKEETANAEIRVNEAGQPEVKSEALEARPGMAYVGIPERR